MKFQLVSTQGKKYDADAYEVIVPTLGGDIAVFEGHMPLISAAEPGVLSVRRKAEDADSALLHFAINGGTLQVDGEIVRFIASDITADHEIIEHEATAAVKRAEELLQNAGSQAALEEAHRLLHHSSAKLRIAGIKKRHHN